MATKRGPTQKKENTVTGAQIRMYRLGTGDCFVIKFLAGRMVTFKMMIDCGSWQGKKERFQEAVADLKKYVDNQVDVLLVTHEHMDHVLGFEYCKDLLSNDFKVGQTWMSWAEDDNANAVKTLKKNHGEKKKALSAAAKRLTETLPEPNRTSFAAQKHFSSVVSEFSSLHAELTVNGDYIGPLKGMKVVKEKIGKVSGIRYLTPGEILEDIPGLKGIRIHILGPPSDYEKSIKVEASSQSGETYVPNKELRLSDLFAAAVLDDDSSPGNLLPFDPAFENVMGYGHNYEDPKHEWRRIDNDWLMSAGNLALRLTTGINNLSLALAIEFIQSGKVMLFPGDAEYGSWASWHQIKWDRDGIGKREDGKPKHLTEDLLNRTVFYKVAHHLSHNGTAQRLGLGMMNHKDLAAMATLDYEVISSGWKSTMPNQRLLTDLLKQSKGRLMVMNLENLFFDAKHTTKLSTKIKSSRELMSTTEKTAFDRAFEESQLWIDYKVKG